MTDTLPKLRVTDPHSNTISPVLSPTLSSQGPFSPGNGRTIGTRPRSRQQNERSSDNTVPAPPRSQTSSPAKPVSNVSPEHNGEGRDGSVPAIDPLSQHILKRTKTGTSTVEKFRPSAEGILPRSHGLNGDITQSPRASGEVQRTDSFSGSGKEKKKGVSFLSRFMGGNKKKSTLDGTNDFETDNGDFQRPEGKEAELFSQQVDNLGFSPKHPQPPAYIKVRARFKREKEFDRVFLAQELRTGTRNSRRSVGPNTTPQAQAGAGAGSNPIWALEFSKDGKFLATGGQDKVVRVWAVISSAEERRAHEREEAAAEPPGSQILHLSAPVFQKKAIREYEGHTSTILDLSWSKNNFLLSSSMDKTVRLWHISRNECLCTFKHTDFVPSIQFHPRDDRFFLAGSLDNKLRLWSIPDKNVAFWNQLPDMITAVSFTPDGKTAIAGTLNGLCQFYETEGLKYQTQIHVKSTHGKNAKGSKITGIQTINVPPDGSSGEVKVLISSNDSRIRLYNMRDKSLEVKFKAHENSQSQIRATFSDDAKYVICGSEDRKAYVFSTGHSETEKRNQRPVEMFEAHTSITTCAILAPTSSRQLLSHSEDPVYDLCNPPPVTLMGKAESVASSRPADEAGSVQPTPVESSFTRATETPAYIARSIHHDGKIFVTADYSGSIKVFRQDCAFSKRRHDHWETSSVFSKRVGSTRAMSIATKGSNRSRRDSTSTQPPNDRIMSWRQDIVPANIADSLSLRTASATARSKTRSVSPRKSMGGLSMTSTTAAMRQGDPLSISTPDLAHAQSPSLPQSKSSSPTHAEPTREKPPVPLFDSERNPMWVQDKQSYAFWDTTCVQNQADHSHPVHAGGLEPLGKIVSGVSALSSEQEGSEGYHSACGEEG